jgi:hypothetical protein
LGGKALKLGDSFRFHSSAEIVGRNVDQEKVRDVSDGRRLLARRGNRNMITSVEKLDKVNRVWE